MGLTLDGLLTYFPGMHQRQANGSYKVICPHHYDKEPSLSISNGNDEKLLLKCHAGCDTRDILADIGLTMADINGDKPTITWKSKAEFWMKKPIEAVYDYKDQHGKYLYSKVRFEGKTIKYGVLDKAKDKMDFSVKGIERVLYNLPDLKRAVNDGYSVYIVEGEKDVETMQELGLTATTCGGAEDWKKGFAQCFIGAKVIILPDNDAPGMKLKDKILHDLKHYAHSTKWLTTSKAEKGDVSDYILKEGHDKDDLKALVDAVPAIVAPWIEVSEKKDGTQVQRVNEGQLANSILKSTYLVIARKKGFESDILYEYQGGVYKSITPLELKGIAQRYVPIAIGKDSIFRGVANRLLYTANNRIIDFEAMNYNERYINLENGLYDAEDLKIINHTPKLLSTIQLNCRHQEQYIEPYHFTKYMNELCTDTEGNVDFQKMAVLQEWAGLILSNVWGHRVKKCLILYSPLGNTGKSLFLSIMRELLGVENVANVSIQKMATDRWAGAGLYAKRLDAVGDQQANDITDSSVFKEVIGGDAITVEFKGKQPFPYVFRGVVGIACNELPVFTDDKGGHVYERLNILPCFNVIPKEQRDSSLLEKILSERDMVFKWALVGLHRLIDNKYIFSQCNAAEAAMKEYRSRSNTIYRFLVERYDITGNEKKDRVSKLDFARAYNAFCIEKGLSPVKTDNIPKRMEKEGFPLKLYCGYQYYKGIEQKEFIDMTDEQIEF